MHGTEQVARQVNQQISIKMTPPSTDVQSYLIQRDQIIKHWLPNMQL